MTEPSPLDMWTLLLSTIRYSFGRMTTMSDEAPSLVIRYNAYLNLHQLKQIVREIHEELALAERYEGHMGMKCDVRAWKEGAEKIQAVITTREGKGENEY